MEDCFAIFYEYKLLIILRGLDIPFPSREAILDWYGKNYLYDRSKLNGVFSLSIDVSNEEFK